MTLKLNEEFNATFNAKIIYVHLAPGTVSCQLRLFIHFANFELSFSINNQNNCTLLTLKNTAMDPVNIYLFTNFSSVVCGNRRCWAQAKAHLRNQLKLSGPRDLGHAHFQGNYLCASSAFPIQSRILNSKSLAQVVFEILRSKCIGVTSLTFHGHVTSSVMWPFDSPYAISY